MKPYQEKLEGSYRLVRIKGLKRAILLFILVLAFAGWAYIWFANKAGLKPFYAPIDAALPWLLIMLLAVSAAAIAFRDLEIRYAKRDSQRYLMANNSQRRAVWTIIIAIILIVLLFLPQTAQAASNGLSRSEKYQLSGGKTLNITFTNQDSLGLTKVEWFGLEATGGTLTARIFVDDKELSPVWTLMTGQQKRMKVYSEGESIRTYMASITNSQIGVVDVTYVSHVQLASALTFTVPIIFILFVVVNAGWIVRLMPIKGKYATASIYSIDYSEQVDKGEQVFSKYEVRKEIWAKEQTPGVLPPPEEAAAASPPPPEPSPAWHTPAGTGAPPPPPAPGTKLAEPFKAETPKAFDVFIKDGSKLFTLGDYEGALKNFDSALGVEPNNITALLARGNALHRLNNPREALIAFDRVLRLESSNERALRSKAVILVELRQWFEAIKALDACLHVNPADADMLGTKGDVLMEMGKRADAALSYETALNLRPDDEALKTRLERARLDIAALLSGAMVSTASGDYPRALGQYEEILRLEPNNTRALGGKAGVLRRWGRKEEAITALDSVLQIEPANPNALLERAKLLMEAGRIPEAKDSVDKLVTTSPGDARVWLIRGDLLADQTAYDEAKASYTQALSLEPGNPDALRKIEMVDKTVAGVAQGMMSRELDSVRGIGPAKIRSLYEAGFKKVDDLKNATVDQLVEVKGISRKLAEEIMQHFSASQASASPPETGAPRQP